MLALFTGRLRMWLIAGIALPLVGLLARKLSQHLDATHQGNSTPASRVLRKTADVASRRATKRRR